MAKTYEMTFADRSARKGTAWSEPSPADPTAYMHPTLWGMGLLEGRKPVTKQEYLDYFTGWAYVAANTNAQAVASATGRLYIQKDSKDQKFKTIKTQPVDREQKDWLRSKKHIRPYITKAAEIEEVIEHPFLTLLHDVNPFYTSIYLWELTSLFMDLTGEAYWLLLRDGLKTPKQIWVIPSQYIEPIPGGEYGDEFVKGYKYRTGAQEVEIPLENIVRFIFPNPKCQYSGFSCIQGVADAVYNASEMNVFEQALFKNKGRLGGMITMEEFISDADKERLALQFKQKYAGSRKAGTIPVLPKGMKFTPDTMTPTEMSFIEGRKVSREEITAGLDVPFGVFDVHANRATADAADYRHAKNGVTPRLTKCEVTVTEDFLPMYGNMRGRLFYAFDDVVPEDKAFLQEQREGNTKANIITINEAREEMGMDPVPWGDVAWVDNRLVPVENGERIVPELPPEKPPKEEPKEEEADKFAHQVRDKVRALLG